MNVLVVDLGIGNIQSLTSALGYLGLAHTISSDPASVVDASHVILPGVGSFDAAMEAMAARGFAEPLRLHAVAEMRPLLGVCLGMQLLTSGSEEGELPGLGLVPGHVRRLAPDRARHRKVPHVGFSTVHGHEPTGLFHAIEASAQFYFTHSYGLDRVSDHPDDVNATYCEHSVPFVAGFQQENICGVQFHPEKSQSTGLRLLSNFFEFVGSAACSG